MQFIYYNPMVISNSYLIYFFMDLSWYTIIDLFSNKNNFDILYFLGSFDIIKFMVKMQYLIYCDHSKIDSEMEYWDSLPME